MGHQPQVLTYRRQQYDPLPQESVTARTALQHLAMGTKQPRTSSVSGRKGSGMTFPSFPPGKLFHERHSLCLGGWAEQMGLSGSPCCCLSPSSHSPTLYCYICSCTCGSCHWSEKSWEGMTPLPIPKQPFPPVPHMLVSINPPHPCLPWMLNELAMALVHHN